MTEQIKRLETVDEKLENIQARLVDEWPCGVLMGELRDARQLLTLTTDLLRQDYGKKARAQQAAIELLRAECAAIDTYNPMNCSRHFRLTQVIALLDGSEEEEEYEAE